MPDLVPQNCFDGIPFPIRVPIRTLVGEFPHGTANQNTRIITPIDLFVALRYYFFYELERFLIGNTLTLIDNLQE